MTGAWDQWVKRFHDYIDSFSASETTNALRDLVDEGDVLHRHLTNRLVEEARHLLYRELGESPVPTTTLSALPANLELLRDLMRMYRELSLVQPPSDQITRYIDWVYRQLEELKRGMNDDESWTRMWNDIVVYPVQWTAAREHARARYPLELVSAEIQEDGSDLMRLAKAALARRDVQCRDAIALALYLRDRRRQGLDEPTWTEALMDELRACTRPTRESTVRKRRRQELSRK